MLMLSERALRQWSDKIGISDLRLAEIDFRIVNMLGAIFDDGTLNPILCLKGGTAINKLYLGEFARFSVDLDFNHLGEKEGVQQQRNDLVARLRSLLSARDNYRYELKRNYSQSTLTARYTSAGGAPNQRIKLEISHVERFPVLPKRSLELCLPNDTRIYVSSYALEELVSTKLRALYERRKGRDVYDLHAVARDFKLDTEVVRKLVLYYFYRSRKVFNSKDYFARITEAIKEKAFQDDIRGFLRSEIEFDLYAAAQGLLQDYAYIGDLDERDNDFLMLARTLLRKGEIPKEKRGEISSIVRPLAELFGKKEITEEAKKITAQDIAPYRKPTKD